MTTYLLTVLLTLSSFSVQGPDDRYIDWTATRKLKWSDFKARPQLYSGNAALTSSSIDMKYGYNHRKLTWTIRCHFDRNLSWARVKNHYILAHEQGHFDIAELYARKLNKALKQYHFNARTAGSDVNHIYRNVMRQHHEMQQRYDRETDFSRNERRQRSWSGNIQQWLRENAAYAQYR